MVELIDQMGFTSAAGQTFLATCSKPPLGHPKRWFSEKNNLSCLREFLILPYVTFYFGGL